MFGGFGAGRFNAMRQTAAKAGPAIEVTEDQMLKAFIASGLTEKKAQFQVNIEKTLRSEVLIGNKLFKLVDKK
jgi:hypothetical protein